MGQLVHRVATKEVPRFGGIRRDCDPGSIPPSMFRDAVNIRYRGGVPINRGGQEKRTATPLTGAPAGIFSSEYRFITPLGAGVAPPAAGCMYSWGGGLDVDGPRVYFAAGQGYYIFGDTQQPWKMALMQHSAYPNNDYALQSFDGITCWVAGDDGTDLRLSRFSRGGVPALVATFPKDDPVYTMVSSLGQLGSDIYLATLGNAEDECRIYKYSGGALVLDDNVGGPGTIGGYLTTLGTLGSDLYYVRTPTSVGGGGNGIVLIRRKPLGGSWSTLTPSDPAFSPSWGPPVIFGGELYYFGFKAGSGLVIKIAGTSVTTVRTGGPTSPHSPVLFNGLIYYLWPGGGNHLYIGSFDGTTWTDSVKDITAQFADLTTIAGGVPRLIEYEGCLRLQANSTDLGSCPTRILTSPGPNISGSWTKELANHSLALGTAPNGAVM